MYVVFLNITIYCQQNAVVNAEATGKVSVESSAKCLPTHCHAS